ncbi:MAG: hypothetical protein Q7R39_04565 [Dehalococcoidia bacterium]|nr:hypothetical protein [Dehalococcoidia bacterium]
MTRIFIAHFCYGGIAPQTHLSILQLMTHPAEDVEVTYSMTGDDALISRSRSKTASEFLRSNCDVLFMVDHDIEFKPEDLIATCQKALEKQALVSGMVSVRHTKGALASRFKDEPSVRLGADGLYEAAHVGTGFLAIPRIVLETMVAELTGQLAPPDLRIIECISNYKDPDVGTFYDFFRCFVEPSEVVPNTYEYLGEDISFSRRAKECGVGLYLYAKPRLKHWGQHGFSPDMAWLPVQGRP